MYKIEYASTRVIGDIKKIPENERQKLINTIESEIIKPLNKRIKSLEQYKKKKEKKLRLRLDNYRIIFSKDKIKKL